MPIITICAIAKNEDKYIEDWLVYHYLLGFTNVTIYDNNIPERKGELSKMLSESNKLSTEMKAATEVIEVLGELGCQKRVYNEYYNTHKFDWCAFIDIDEFITLVKWNNIIEMLSDRHFNDADAIFLVWDTISDDDIVDVPDNYVYNGKLCKYITDPSIREAAAKEWEKTPVYERFHNRAKPYGACNCKMLLRSHIQGIQVEIHHFVCNTPTVSKFATGDEKEYKPYYNRTNMFVFNKALNYAYIRHYRTKSLREFLTQKYLNKTDADNAFSRTLFLDDYFFQVNNKTPKKIDYYNRNHEPITMHLIVDEKDFDPVNNGRVLSFIPAKKDKSSNPFVVDQKFVTQHMKHIDRVIII